MEQLTSSLEFNNSASILGEKDQVLQIVLKRNDSIVVKRMNISYFSTTNLEEIVYHKVNIILKEMQANFKNLRVKDMNLVRLKNVNNDFEYIGLHTGGKIMKIQPILYSELCVRYDCVLAFSDSIDLIEDGETNLRIGRYSRLNNVLFQEPKFYLVQAPKSDVSFENFALTDICGLKDMLYLSNDRKNVYLLSIRLLNREEIRQRRGNRCKIFS